MEATELEPVLLTTIGLIKEPGFNYQVQQRAND